MTQILPIAPPTTEAADAYVRAILECRNIMDRIDLVLAKPPVPYYSIHWGHVGTVSALCELLRQAQEVCEGLSNPNE